MVGGSVVEFVPGNKMIDCCAHMGCVPHHTTKGDWKDRIDQLKVQRQPLQKKTDVVAKTKVFFVFGGIGTCLHGTWSAHGATIGFDGHWLWAQGWIVVSVISEYHIAKNGHKCNYWERWQTFHSTEFPGNEIITMKEEELIGPPEPEDQRDSNRSPHRLVKQEAIGNGMNTFLKKFETIDKILFILIGDGNDVAMIWLPTTDTKEVLRRQFCQI